MSALAYRSTTANMSYYGEPGPEHRGRIWTQVIRSTPLTPEDPQVVTFHLAVYCTGIGHVADLRGPDYPKRSAPARLTDEQVTDLVLGALYPDRLTNPQPKGADMATATETPAKAAGSKPSTAASKAKKQRTVREAIKMVLEGASEPMTPADIYKEIRRRRLAPGLKGQTPEATVSAQLSIHGEFERVSRGHYKLGT